MKLKFKNQGFQEAATAAVCDVFEGQSYRGLRGSDPIIYVKSYMSMTWSWGGESEK